MEYVEKHKQDLGKQSRLVTFGGEFPRCAICLFDLVLGSGTADYVFWTNDETTFAISSHSTAKWCVGCPSFSTAESHGQKGRIQLYSPSIDQMQPPMYHEKFVIDERGMAAILLIVPASDYTVVAFIDANDNGQLDFDGERAIEAFDFHGLSQ